MQLQNIYIIQGDNMKRKTPIRTIDSIEYVYDYTKGDNLTGGLCGHSVVAMLTGVSLDEVVEVSKKLTPNEPATKKVLKKWLDYYGIKYAPKSTRFDESVSLPDICILRLMYVGTKIGHWNLFYKGKYYDPDYGVHDVCPSIMKPFQVWEIYP